MRLYKALSLILLLTIPAAKGSAQIFSPSAADSFAASYNPPGGTDKVFIYNQPVYKANQTASIVAVPADRLPGWNFQWAVWDPSAGLYVNLPASNNGEFSSIDTIRQTSGYQVTLSKDTVTYQYRVWLIFNDFQVEITNKDADNKLQFGYYNCSSLDLRADTTLVQTYYFNPVTLSRINIYNNYSIRWKSDNTDASLPANRLITRVNNPPSEDSWYYLTLTDRFHLVRKDSVFYVSIQSDAKMTATYINLSDSLEYSRDLNYDKLYNDGVSDEKNRSAPGKYKFDISESRNSATYKIDFADGEIFETDSAGKGIVHEFKTPGTYKVLLTSKSAKPYECVDTDSSEVTLAYGFFELPNVFTPNSSGNNDLFSNNNVFRSEDVSIVTIDITIFDRAGLKVHTYAGNMRDWEGWDGEIMKSHRKAPEGVYFYVISALFYYKDPVNDPIKKGIYKGFFHLYR